VKGSVSKRGLKLPWQNRRCWKRIYAADKLAHNSSASRVDTVKESSIQPLKDDMKPQQDKPQEAPQFIQRRGFYLDILKYAETRPAPLDAAQSGLFLEAYNRLKSPLGHASYTDVARALGLTALEIMQHVKYLHISGREWQVRFSNNRNNENVFFKLLPK
jgi:hypothetical protein